jgi:hypothetical protein
MRAIYSREFDADAAAPVTSLLERPVNFGILVGMPRRRWYPQFSKEALL